jgi:hypothetical protein
MKNIHVLPTDKPSRLYKTGNFLLLDSKAMPNNTLETMNQHIYITSDEEIKEGDWVIENHTFKREPYIGKCFYPKNDGTVTDEVLKRDLLSVNYEGHYETLALKHNCKKIILTDNKDLIKDGVQAIDDEFLKWFVKNPSCESVPIITTIVQDEAEYKTNIGFESWRKEEPKQELPQLGTKEFNDLASVYFGGNPKKETDWEEQPKQETLEEAADSNSLKYKRGDKLDDLMLGVSANSFIDGANYQAERMYSEEEVQLILSKLLIDIKNGNAGNSVEWFEQFKKNK